ncbi:MAG: phosphotransferase [Pseudomonadales bacterium]|jgi:hypothetical protein|nr:phosphotransferase [Pseudomonadales bacterium]MDP6470104.1 phosphotransferase [Pseudomonadales bacterium]MDP6827007.1 phosphotransferase [Pseudomonadales bacterium]MDP6972065.1 phosphotransferase [Pseudomonadales bacterium]|tara:strand:- start:2812 stop:3879 length:1068 start_codon:yes stop_codon:yes gene_type:complete
MPQIISDPDAVTPAWLSEVLAHAGIHASVSSFTAEHIGTGQVGDNVRFRLRYTPGSISGPRSIIGKFASQDPVSRETGKARNTYIKEVRFYRELQPTVDIRTPRPLFAAIEPEAQDFCIMMEDLYPARQGDQISGCLLPEATLAVVELAGLHAPYWNDPRLETLAWLEPPDRESAEFGEALYNQLLPAFTERYAHRLSDAHFGVARRFGECFMSWSLDYDGPVSITHGDYRLDNMLFGGSYPLTVVDWQTPSIGAPASDLSYFIGAGLKTGSRQLHERDLVAAYHGALIDKGVCDYTFDACWLHYRRYAYSGLLMAVVASMIVGQTDRGDDMFMAMARRHAQQVLDLESESLIQR